MKTLLITLLVTAFLGGCAVTPVVPTYGYYGYYRYPYIGPSYYGKGYYSTSPYYPPFRHR